MDHGFDLEYDHNPSGPLGMSRTLPEREFVRNSLTAIISAHSIIPSPSDPPLICDHVYVQGIRFHNKLIKNKPVST